VTSGTSVDAPPGTAAYVYGVVAARDAPDLSLDGVAGAPVDVVPEGGLAALVSPVPQGTFRVRRRDLFSHLRVLEEAFAEATVVPCAFGMVLPSEDAVRSEFLGARADELHGLLRRLDGFVQLNVRASYDEDVVLREIVAADPAIADLREQVRVLGDAGYHARIALGERVAAALAVRREQDGRALYERLSKRAAEVSVDGPGEQDVLKASFLVARKQVRAFDDELDAIARTEAPRLRLDTFGPLPPAAFVSLKDARWGS
jgi:gas vesicle protein GvpL/GvpF